MSRPLPHRKSTGQCRECGTYDAQGAPGSCCRCALERMDDRDYQVIVDMTRRWMSMGDELWRQVHPDILTGAIKSDRFYLYVGHNDGGSLGLPMGDLTAQQWAVLDARTAHATAQALTQRYPQVWVVTTVGCWNAVRPREGAST